MKKLTFNFLIAAVLVILAAACKNESIEPAASGSDVSSERLASLEEQIDRMEQTIKTLEDAIAASDRELKEELQSQIDKLEEAVEALQNAGNGDLDDILDRLKAVESAVAGYDALTAKVNEIESKLGDKPSTAEVTAMLGELKAEIAGQISSLHTELAACQDAIAGLAGSIAGLQSQLDSMQSALAASLNGKVDNETYEAFVQQTNEQMQLTSTLLSELLAVCSGFEGTSAKEYIDTAIDSITSLLDNYVLKSTYEAFIEEYGRTKEEIQGQIDANKAKIAELEAVIETLKEMLEQGGSGELGELTALTQKIGELTVKVENLEKNSVTLEQVQAQFTKDNEAFFNGVNGILADALADGGIISEAIAKSAEALRNEYIELINSLESRIGALESTVADLIDRIQSLVYVPKTSDGKIHIGTTYIAETDEAGNETGGRIEVTPTKKLEYRVSPANLRDKLLTLSLDCFSFYQEHVTRAEGSGMDEFHILKIEEGNGPGELLLTVDNDHDFTHEDLAVALCIKHTSQSGVVTEFTSPYTTVVGDGRNIRDRFYLAKQFNGEWAVCRDDNISYLIRYDDTATTVAFSNAEYQVVYDTGESILTIDEAKERFEWEIDLKASAEGLADGFAVSGMQSGSYSVIPSNPNADRTKIVSLNLKQVSASNIRGKISDKYCVYLSDGENSVRLIPEVDVTVTVIGAAYAVESSQIVWNYSTWNAGRNTSATEYQTKYSNIYSTVYSSNRTDLSHIPDNDLNEILPRNAAWDVKLPENSTIQGTVNVTSGLAQADGTRRNLQFTVSGYLYSDAVEKLTLTRTVKPSHLVGSKPITISAVVDIVAPEARTANLDIQSVASTVAKAYVYYFNISDAIKPRDRIPVYSDEEVAKFFNGSKSSVSNMLAIGSLNSTKAWTDNEGRTLPVKAELIRNDDTGSTIVANSLAVYPSQISPAPVEPGTYVFTAPADYWWNVPNGPKIPITGTVSIDKLN